MRKMMKNKKEIVIPRTCRIKFNPYMTSESENKI